MSQLLLNLVVGASLFGAEPNTDDVRRLIKSDAFTVTWSTPQPIPSDAELEIGDGNGHGGTLRWLRFCATADGVGILSIELDKGYEQYRGKLAPDTPRATIKSARMPAANYQRLLADLATIDAAEIREPAPETDKSGVERLPRQMLWSSHDFWVATYVAAGSKTLIDLNWAGYDGSHSQLEWSKPRAATRRTNEYIESLEWKQHLLSPAERAWASAKFCRDWPRIADRQFYWWVGERYVTLIGLVGDRDALSQLAGILREERSGSKARVTYNAINAATRLTGVDVRSQPPEKMNLDEIRPKVLGLVESQIKADAKQ